MNLLTHPLFHCDFATTLGAYFQDAASPQVEVLVDFFCLVVILCGTVLVIKDILYSQPADLQGRMDLEHNHDHRERDRGPMRVINLVFTQVAGIPVTLANGAQRQGPFHLFFFDTQDPTGANFIPLARSGTRVSHHINGVLHHGIETGAGPTVQGNPDVRKFGLNPASFANFGNNQLTTNFSPLPIDAQYFGYVQKRA